MDPTPAADDVPQRFAIDFTGTLLGVVQVRRRLAEGGMGTVYLAEDTSLGRRVVVKVPHARFLGEPGFRSRFRREVSELVRLEHPHIVRILAQGEHEELPYFVLQYLAGGSLEDQLDDVDEPLEADAVLPWLPTIARTLDFVHERGVVHRDVKPANILFDDSGHVFLSDFGVVKALEGDPADLTAAGTGVGSPRYMAPEQGLGRKVTAAADQYSLASTVYEALAGRSPFEDENAVQVLIRKDREDPAPLTEVAPHVSAAVAAVVHRALSRDPEARYPSCTAFAEAFVEALERTARPGAVRSPHADDRNRARYWVVPAVIGLVAVLVAALMAGGRPGGGEDPQPPAPTDGRVVLLRPGQEPRRTLRYRMEEGRTYEMTALSSSRVTMTQRGTEEKPPAVTQVPRTLTRLDVTVQESREGRTHLAWTVAAARLTEAESPTEGEDEDRASFTAALSRLEGVRGHVVVSDRGLEIEAELDADPEGTVLPQIAQTMRQTLRQATVPLPAEPVGVGAKWEVTEVQEAMGMRVTITTTYEVRALDGDVLTVRTSVAAIAPEQDIRLPNMPDAYRADLKRLHATGGGTTVQSLLLPVPRSLDTELSLELEIEGEFDGEPQSLHLDQDTSLEVRGTE